MTSFLSTQGQSRVSFPAFLPDVACRAPVISPAKKVAIQFSTIVDEPPRELLGGVPSYRQGPVVFVDRPHTSPWTSRH